MGECNLSKEKKIDSKQQNNTQKTKNYKRFSLDSRIKFMKYLNRLICQVYPKLDRYKKYKKEMEEITYSHIEFDENYKIKSTTNITAYEYESINDKIHNISMELVKFIGDRANDSASYLKFREMIEKNTIGVPFNKLSDEINEHLKEINNLRNWMFHNPESLYVSEEEYTKASVEI
jgi:hypothetical protein